MTPGIKIATIETIPDNKGWYCHSREKQINPEILITSPEMNKRVLRIMVAETIVAMPNSTKMIGTKLLFKKGKKANAKIIMLRAVVIQRLLSRRFKGLYVFFSSFAFRIPVNIPPKGISK